ncbi:hypothetical protein S7711_10092 [Stachybotrys chartarum IBT 7711]|uniref:Aminoglycoside phosphotransferase domain-containing protein n=2 Tax=Stachybotrys TaxID=74721 RepID=A0A084BB16_STACB|nr:hypothetical protein S7711_10092 [Stachybotrys chartarum IBT 7711]
MSATDDDVFVVLQDSTFFKQKRAASLPSPSNIRDLANASTNPFAVDFNRPSPISIPSLGLFVKYGADVPVVEAKTQMKMHALLKGRVPIPEVYGWRVDSKQTFIYMELVKGETLSARWGDLREDTRLAICEELRDMVHAWRSLKQDSKDPYIGSDGGEEPLNEIFFADRPWLRGPYRGQNAVEQLHQACSLDIRNDVPIVFTHNDIAPPNILLTPGPIPKIAAIIDWTQSGWYPAYWESCKARRIGFLTELMSEELQDEWHDKYLPRIVDMLDDEAYYHPFIRFEQSII